MRVFIEGEVDVLVATTIIESGVDIPAAGTIIIDHADEFGLAELHQLRGRVGRGRQKSWCYLLVEGTKPIREVAKERLKALEELTQLGAGFAISMKDLEIRGAGNILGPQQSGHIAAIGYDMYCRLLKQTVERLQAGGEIEAEELVAEQESQGCELELGLRSFLPDAWIPDPKVRLDILRQLSTVRSHEDAQQALATCNPCLPARLDFAAAAVDEAVLLGDRRRVRVLPGAVVERAAGDVEVQTTGERVPVGPQAR